MAAAIRERRILSLMYAGVERQLFVPLALYVSESGRLMVDGYEIQRKRVRWRNLDIESARDVRQTDHTYSFISGPTPIGKTYRQGTAVLVDARLE